MLFGRKRVAVELEYNVDLAKLKQMAEQVRKVAASPNVSVDVKTKLRETMDEIRAFEKGTTIGTDGLVDAKDLEITNKRIQKLLESISSGAKKAMTQIGKEAKISTQEIEDLNKEIEALTKKRDALAKKKTMAYNPASFAAKHNLDIPDNAYGKDLVKGLGNIKALDKYADKLKLMEASFSSLEKMTKRGAVEEKKYQELLANKDIRKALLEDVEAQQKGYEATTKALEELNKALAEKEQLLKAEYAKQQAPEELLELAEASKIAGEELIKYDDAFDKAQTEELTTGFKVLGEAVSGTTDKFKEAAKSIISTAVIYQTLKRTLREAVRTVKDLDSAFNEMAIVTSYTTKETWKMKDAFEGIAQTTGFTTTEIAKLSVEYFRQGRSLSEVLRLTEATAAAARIANISTAESVRYLTSAINGFQLSANQAMAVSDKFAALSASSASSYEELATALSKVAAQAYSAGVNMDNMMGFIAKAIETTREAPENIGTAFKTIFARMSEIKDFGATLEDGMDVNRIEKALKTVNVELRNSSGEMRNLDDVLIEVGRGWNGLNKNQKAYLATALAGTRQQTRLLAVMESFDRTMELVEVSANSLGATYAQQAKYTDSIAFSMNKLTVAYQGLISGLVKSDVIVALVKILASMVEMLSDAVKGFNSLNPVIKLASIGMTIYTGILIANAIAAHKAGKANVELKNAIDLLSNASIKKAMKDLASGSTTLTKTLSPLKDLLVKLIAPTKAFLGTLGAFSGVLAVFGGLAVGGFLLYKHIKNVNNRVKDLNESVHKAQAEIYNFGKRASDLESLRKKWEDLDGQIVKTSEDIAKMNDLVDQMQDLLGEDVQIRDAFGNVNMELVTQEIDKARKDQNEKFEESMKDIQKRARKYFKGSMNSVYNESNDFAVRQQLEIAKAMEISGKTYSELMALGNKEQDKLMRRAKAEINIPIKTELVKMGDDHGFYYVSVEVQDIDPEQKAKAEQIMDELFNNDFVNKSLSEQFKMLQELGVDSLDETAKNYLASFQPAILTLTKIQEITGDKFEELMNTTELSASGLEDLFNAFKGTGLEAEQLNEVFTQGMLNGPAAALETVIKNSEKWGLEMGSILQIANQINSALSDVTDQQIDGMITSLRSVEARLSKVGKMISGEEALDMTELREVINAYPEIGEHIVANGEISEEVIGKIISAEKDALKNKLALQNIELEQSIAVLEAEKLLYEAMSKDKEFIEKQNIHEISNMNDNFLDDLLGAYKKHLEAKSDMNAQANLKMAQDNFKTGLGTLEDLQNAQAAAQNKLVVGFSKNNLAKGPGVDSQNFFESSLAGIDAQINRLRGQINANKLVMQQIDSGALFGKGSKAEKASKEYEAQMNEIYIIMQKIAALNNQMSQLEAEKQNATGEEYIKILNAQANVTQLLMKETEELTNAQRRQQQTLLNGLTPALSQSVKIINGRAYPIMDKYQKLNSQAKEGLDQFINSFNELTDSIDANGVALANYNKELAQYEREKRDTIIRAQETLVEAVKNEQQKILDAIKDRIAKEKKLIDDRKKLYQDSFKEEDYQNELAQIDEERADVVKQLAALEGATDLQSNARRADLLNRKLELDKQYNDKSRDYNRQAVLDMLDADIERLEKQEEEAQNHYDRLITDTEWLESQVTAIMNGGVDKVVEYLKENHPNYVGALSLVKEDMIEEWDDLYSRTKTIFDNLEKELPSFDEFFKEIQAAMEAMNRFNASGSGGSGGATSPKTTTPKSDPTPITTTDFIWTPWRILNSTTHIRDRYRVTFVNGKETSRTFVNSETKKVTQSSGSVNSFVPGMQAFSTGGEANFTGPAWLDGTKKRPERVLSAEQTESFNRLVATLEKGNSPVDGLSIGQISIIVDSINQPQDLKKAAQGVALEIHKALTERGISVNKRR